MFRYYLFESDLRIICSSLEKDLRKFENSHIFISGATGIIGKWILAALLFADDTLDLNLSISILTRNKNVFGKNYPLLCLDRRLNVIEGDVRNFYTDIEIDYFIHGAADVIKKNVESETYLTNILGTHNALNQAIKSNSKRFLYLSSGAVYGKSGTLEKGIVESNRGEIDFLNPNSSYALGKCGGEFLTMSAADESSISVSSARCFSMAGPHLPLDKHFAFGNFMLSALNNEKISITGNGKVYRSYLYLADVCIWLLKILINGENKISYNVGSDISISILELAEKIKFELDSSIEISVGNLSSDQSNSNYYFPNTSFTKESLNLEANYSLADMIKITANWHIEGLKRND
jgi:nucleoside-diphosphate-sugar epimerase